MSSSFGVVDLFAGPGGLGEGFASFRANDRAPFDTLISVEKEASAHQTLRLRAFLREYALRHGALPRPFVDFHAGHSDAPEWQAVDPEAWQQAVAEARCLELGSPAASEALGDAFRSIPQGLDDTVLIGGPPCQAYSLIGRARSRGKVGYVAENDPRHYLFREYLRVLDRLRPTAFVMENVRGMLSSTIESRLVFEMLMEELASLGSGKRNLYQLYAIRVNGKTAGLEIPGEASEFVVCAEDFGVPQRRHRVIIVGIRTDCTSNISAARITLPSTKATVASTIGDLPALRSGLSREPDGPQQWRAAVARAAEFLSRVPIAESLQQEFAHLSKRLPDESPEQRCSSTLPKGYYRKTTDALHRWLVRPQLSGLAQHETRGHMASDLERYLFASVFAERRGSPKASDFPTALKPDHENWCTGVFNDRFRVQLAGEPSTTITSHISKDGHYYIHYDPLQCRSLTVREAARLQTFPDDYLFLGNRTQQYVQVGNAVPPFLARQIAELVYLALAGPHSDSNESAAVCEDPGKTQQELTI